MSFDAYSTTSSEASSASKVDYDAMNKYVIETAQLKRAETLVGVIAGIVDLGIQNLQDAETVYKGTAEEEAEEITMYPNTYFKDGIDQDTGKPARLKCYPQKPQQSVAFAIDFPDILIDKGQFFGKENPQPLRLWLGGNFFNDGKMLVARPTPLKVVNLDRKKAGSKPRWSFSPLHLCYKMAVGAKLIEAGDVFLPNQIDLLVGKSLQFEAQVYMKENKGKEYYTERIKYVGGLGRGQTQFDSDNTFMVQFNKQNSEDSLKQLRNHVINTIKAASNYEGSVIQKQLKQGDSQNDAKEDVQEPVEKNKPVVKTKVKPPVEDDDGIPF